MPDVRNRLQVGSHLTYDGETYEVIGIADRLIDLRSKRGERTRVLLSHLVTSPGFKLHGSEVKERTKSDDHMLESLGEAGREARELARHLLEAITGYQSGSRLDAKPHEPRAQYDPDGQTLSARLRAKAQELGVTPRTLWNKKARFEAHGLQGLVDSRATRLRKSSIDSRVRDAIEAVTESLTEKSNVSKQQIRRLAERHLKATYPDESISLPSESVMNRLINAVAANKGTFGPAKRRRSIANRPQTPYSHFAATRPGEMVLIDSTPFDAFAMDPYAFKWVQLQLTIALDLYTRSIVAWRFTPVSTKAVDAALLLYDILRPKWTQDAMESSARWAYVGVPESILVEIAGDAQGGTLAAIPFLHPESVIVDRGRVFLSEAFVNACRTLGINLFVARPYTATDKAHVERIFRTIRESFVENLAGYKGPDVYSRGQDVEAQAYWFINEIEDEFAKWVANYWQRRHHEGLFLPHVPDLNLSPNNMYDEGLARAGFVYVVPDSRIYYELLPTEWRTLQHYGVELRNLRYDGDILNDFRHEQSPYLGEHAGKWPIRYDSRDRSRVFFYDHVLDDWHDLYWTGAHGVSRPFNDATVSYARRLVVEQGGNEKNHVEMDRVLNALLNRMDDRQVEGAKERRLAAVRAMNAEAAARDRPSGQPLAAPDGEAAVFGTPDPGDQLSADEHAIDQAPTQSGRASLDAYPTVDEAAEDEDDELDF